MKHDDCTGCGLPVLELEGQFELVQPYELQHDELPLDQAGCWHTACLLRSRFGPAWAAVRLRTYRDLRKYDTLAELDAWTVLHHTQGDRIALGRTGELLRLASLGSRRRARKVLAGRVFACVDEGYNLELEDGSVIVGIREGFAAAGSYPLLGVCEALGILNKVHHPVALERGIVSAVRQTESRHFITMRLEYGVFVPDELLPYTGGVPT